MNIIVKSAIAGAIALTGSSAFAAVNLPQSNNSDLFLYVDAVSAAGTSAGVYALDTGVTLSSLMPGGFVSGAKNNSTAFSAPNLTLSATSTLSSFFTAHAGSTFLWTVEGGQYNSIKGSTTLPNTTNTPTAGDALAVFASKILTNNGQTPQVTSANTANLRQYLAGLQGDLSAVGGIPGLTTGKETLGIESVSANTHYNWFGLANDLSTQGSTSQVLFGFTGNNGEVQVQSYILGKATFDSAGTLTINGNTTTTVPLPAAVWLFGSGLMGLVGVSRRRKLETAEGTDEQGATV